MIFGRGYAPAPGAIVREFTEPDHIDVRAGEPFAVVLRDNGPGGYLWRAADLPSSVRLRREDDRAAGVGAPGAAGEKGFELEATQAGAVALCLQTRRGLGTGAG